MQPLKKRIVEVMKRKNWIIYKDGVDKLVTQEGIIEDIFDEIKKEWEQLEGGWYESTGEYLDAIRTFIITLLDT